MMESPARMPARPTATIQRSPTSAAMLRSETASSGDASQASTPPVTSTTSSGIGNPKPHRTSTPKTKAKPTSSERSPSTSTSRCSIRVRSVPWLGLARRELAQRFLGLADPAGQLARDHGGELEAGDRLVLRLLEELAPGQLEHPALGPRHRRDEPHGAREQAEVAEMLARAERREALLLAAGALDDAHRAGHDDEERLADHALDEERAHGRDRPLVRHLGERLEPARAEVLEEGRPLQRLERRHRPDQPSLRYCAA